MGENTGSDASQTGKLPASDCKNVSKIDSRKDKRRKAFTKELVRSLVQTQHMKRHRIYATQPYPFTLQPPLSLLLVQYKKQVSTLLPKHSTLAGNRGVV